MRGEGIEPFRRPPYITMPSDLQSNVGNTSRTVAMVRLELTITSILSTGGLPIAYCAVIFIFASCAALLAAAKII